MKLIKNWIQKQRSLLIANIANEVRSNLTHWMLATIGVDELEKIIEASKENRKLVGHSDYTSLSELWIKIMNQRQNKINQERTDREETNRQKIISMKFDCSIEEWNRFVEEGMSKDFDEIGSNVKYDFDKMTKKFGRAYLSYLEAAYLAKANMSDEEFCKINGNVPIKFLERIK